jgi:hypothetical protein
VLIETSDTVEEGGFPGTVWANDTGYLMFGEFKVEGVDSNETAKSFSDTCGG